LHYIIAGCLSGSGPIHCVVYFLDSGTSVEVKCDSTRYWKFMWSLVIQVWFLLPQMQH